MQPYYVIHCSPDKFANRDNYFNFKRKIQEAQNALKQSGLYIGNDEKDEWDIHIQDATWELNRFVFED